MAAQIRPGFDYFGNPEDFDRHSPTFNSQLRPILFTKQGLGAVQKLFVQNAQDEFVSARRRREACRGTLTDDNAAMTDSDKHYV